MRCTTRRENRIDIPIRIGFRICEGEVLWRIGGIKFHSFNIREAHKQASILELWYEVWYEWESNKYNNKNNSCIVEDLLWSATFELTEVTRSRDDRESCTLRLESNNDDDYDSKNSKCDSHSIIDEKKYDCIYMFGKSAIYYKKNAFLQVSLFFCFFLDFRIRCTYIFCKSYVSYYFEHSYCLYRSWIF